MADSQRTPREAVRPLLRVRQIREFRADAPVTAAEVDAIADAARWSGSSQNTQPWRFITMRDPATLRAVREAGLPQTRTLETASAAIGIVMPVQEGKAVAFAFDEGRAAERVLVAATLLGLGAGIAWIGSAARPAVAERLGIPEGWSLRTIIALGHPTAAAAARKAPPGEARLPRDQTVLPERWHE
jgi:nitroreductase